MSPGVGGLAGMVFKADEKRLVLAEAEKVERFGRRRLRVK